MANKITVFRGTAYPCLYYHTDAAGAAVSLAGKRVYFVVKPAVFDTDSADSSATIRKVITSHAGTIGGVTLSESGGITGFELTDADTYATPGKYHFVYLVEDIATGLTDPPSLYGEFIIKGIPSNAQVGNEV